VFHHRRGQLFVSVKRYDTPMPPQVSSVDIQECEPVGLAEIAVRLEVQRQTANVWRTRGLLPAPRWTVSGSPAWHWPDIEVWARSTGRLPSADELPT